MIGLACVLALSCLDARRARAERQHTVRAGQSLASIARGYAVSINSLAAANRRAAEAPLKPGEVLRVPGRGVVVLTDGQTLWSVARSHGCSVPALARANGIETTTRLRPGTRLVLPSARTERAPIDPPRRSVTSSPSGDVETKVARTRDGRAVRARMLRLATNETLQLTLTDARGRVRNEAVARLARFLRPRNSKKQKRPPVRLVQLMAEVARHYQGRTLMVVSGYRLAGGYTSKESRHTKGQAIDLRVDGVPARALCDYLRTFENVGVGLYPNGGFVHLDVRDKRSYWVDLSSPGRRPSYLDREQRDHFDGKNKDEGLVELGRSVGATVGELDLESDDEAEAEAGGG